MTVKGYRCPNCGKMLTLTDARNNIMKCEACGSEYKIEDDNRIIPYYVHQIPYNTHEIACCSYVPWLFVKENPEVAMNVTLEHMAKEMAKKILPFIEVTSSLDPMDLKYRIDARLRVHVPSQPLEEQLKFAVPEYAKAVEARREE